jgi:hypothetical protein
MAEFHPPMARVRLSSSEEILTSLEICEFEPVYRAPVIQGLVERLDQNAFFQKREGLFSREMVALTAVEFALARVVGLAGKRRPHPFSPSYFATRCAPGACQVQHHLHFSLSSERTHRCRRYPAFGYLSVHRRSTEVRALFRRAAFRKWVGRFLQSIGR